MTGFDPTPKPVRSWKQLRARWPIIKCVLRGETVLYKAGLLGGQIEHTTGGAFLFDCDMGSLPPRPIYVSGSRFDGNTFGGVTTPTWTPPDGRNK